MSTARNSSLYAGAHSADKVLLTGHERFLAQEDTIVSKTNITGAITYANDVFIKISGFRESEIIGAPHSLVRHPAMPRCIFKLLWDTVGKGQEIFAYVVNRCKNGDHYWVFAHVTPCYDSAGKLIGYHSSRRALKKGVLATIEPLYAQLLEVEKQGRKEGLEASEKMLLSILDKKNISYDKFVFTI